MRTRDASFVTIEALMADRLRHSLEELLPKPRRGVYIRCVCVCVCVMSLKECRERELLTPFIYNQNWIASSIYLSEVRLNT